MRLSTLLVGLCLGTALPGAVLAQTAQKPAPAAAPDPALLKVARETVAQMQGDRAATLSSMAAPMVGMMQQMGVPQPDRAQVLVQEVVLPILSSRYDDLVAIQAKAYASVLSVDDMKGALAFYNTPAGQNLIRAQPQLAQLKLSGMTQWIGQLQPEMQSRIQQTIKARGWDKG